MKEGPHPYDTGLLSDAEMQFKLALTLVVARASAPEDYKVYLAFFSYFRHLTTNPEVRLESGEETEAADLLLHSATYIMVAEIDTVLGRLIKNRFSHPNPTIRSASWIARLLRNAFAHNPLSPKWKTYPECDNAVYTVPDIITLNTTGLNGQGVRLKHYGGPFALLRLSQFVRAMILKPLPD